MDISAVGWIGLGAMGLPMTQQLDLKLPVETKIYVYDVVEETIEELLASSRHSRIVRCANTAEVTEKSTLVLTMLPEGKHVRSVYLDEAHSIMSKDLTGKTLIDCSTIDIQSSQTVARRIADQHPGTKFFDAPVSGGVMGAEKGTLTVMVGLSEEDPDWNAAREFLGLMGTSIVACGAPTLGLAAKLCNNYLSGTIAIAASETLNIGIRMGLDPARLSQIIGTSLAQNTIMDKFNPCPGIVPTAPSSNGYKGGFRVQLMRKDYALALEAAKSVEYQTALGQAGLAVYEGASDDPKCKDLDCRVVYRYLNGIEDWKDWEKR